MGARCTLGFDLKPGPITKSDGAWVVGCCHLIGDLDGSGDSPQSPEQGEWIALLQTCPITIGFRVIKLFFCSLGSVFQRLHHLTSMEYCWARLMQPPFVLSQPGGAVHRRPPSPTGDGAKRPAFGPPPPPRASWHSFLRARTIAVRTALSPCPVRRLPTCIANSLPATVVTFDLLPY